MLNTYYSDRIEWLIQLLAKKLETKPPSIFEKIDIHVNNYLLGEWVRNQITINNGIIAYCEFKSISEFTKNIVNNIYPDSENNSWDLESIRWKIIESFAELKNYKESWPIAYWLKVFEDNNQIIDKDLYYFLNTISEIYSDYLIYRPELIYNWHNSEINSYKLFKNLEKDEYWQAILFKLIQKKSIYNSLTINILKIINEIDINKKNNLEIPEDIHIITTNNLARLHISFYEKISHFANINLYILSPGIDLWERINIVDNSSENRLEQINGISNNSKELSLLRFAANFQKMFEEVSFSNQVNLNQEFLYSDPTFINNEDKYIPLLNQFQKKIIKNDKEELQKSNNDNSLIFKGLPNLLKELEFVKDKIIDLIKEDNNLMFKDIAILVPDINLIKKYIKYIFACDKLSGTTIPYLLSKINYKEISDISNYINEIINISTSKINILKLKTLLNNNAIKIIFNINDEDINRVEIILEESGFDWGLDKEDRMGEYRNSLDWCLEKIKLGLIYNEDLYFNKFELSPKETKIDANDLHKIIKLIDLFKAHINLLKGVNSINNWINIIIIILNDFDNKDYEYEINELKISIYEYKEKHNCKVKIDIFTFQECINSIFNKNINLLNNRKNEIIISDINSLRNIPYKYIFVIAMNDIYYPKHINKLNMNIMNKRYLLGDPVKSDKDDFLLVEILMSCRKKFVLTWSQFDKENNKLNIALPVKKMIKFLDNNSSLEKNYNSVVDDLPENNILKNDITNNSNKTYSLIKKINLENNNYDNFFNLSELRKWIKEPQRHWLNLRNIKPQKNYFNSSEKNISPLQKYNFLTKIINKIPINKSNFAENIHDFEFKKEIINEGIVAPRNGIFNLEMELRNTLDSLIEIIQEPQEIRNINIKDAYNKEDFLLLNNEIIELKHSQLKLNNIIDSWIRLLFLSSQKKEIIGTKLIYLKDNKYKIKKIKTPEFYDSREILMKYLNIYKNSLVNCLPVPPDSGYKFINAQIYKIDNAEEIFRTSWVGNSFNAGERDKTEMQLCFGYEREPEFFIENEISIQLALSIYKPLIKSLEE